MAPDPEFDTKRLQLYRQWHEYLAKRLIETANEVGRVATLGDLEGLELRCAELLHISKSLRANGDAMSIIQMSTARHS